MNDEKLKISTTTNGQPPEPGWENGPAPAPIDPKTGQYKAYWVLSEEERKKGFIRPVRYTYKHVGTQPKYPLRDLTQEERERYDKFGWVAFEKYPEDSSKTGRYWTKKQLKGGCGTNTTMGKALAETYARDPKYYGGTFCCGCKNHFPVEEFIWVDDLERVGT